VGRLASPVVSGSLEVRGWKKIIGDVGQALAKTWPSLEAGEGRRRKRGLLALNARCHRQGQATWQKRGLQPRKKSRGNEQGAMWQGKGREEMGETRGQAGRPKSRLQFGKKKA